MKILLAVFADRPLTRRQWCRCMLLLHQRGRRLQRAGCAVSSLGVTDNLAALSDRYRSEGADGLWLTIADGGRALRRQFFRDPSLLDGISVYADGAVGPNLPPTRGQLRQLTAMGITYLPQRPGRDPGDLLMDVLCCSAGAVVG